MQKILELATELEGSELTVTQAINIEMFIEKGVPENELKEALIRSYTNKSVDKPWNYFCAICWRIINRTQKGSVGESVGNYGKFPWS